MTEPYSTVAYEYYRSRLEMGFTNDWIPKISEAIQVAGVELVAAWIALPARSGPATSGLLVAAKYFSSNAIGTEAQYLFKDDLRLADLCALIRNQTGNNPMTNEPAVDNARAKIHESRKGGKEKVGALRLRAGCILIGGVKSAPGWLSKSVKLAFEQQGLDYRLRLAIDEFDITTKGNRPRDRVVNFAEAGAVVPLRLSPLGDGEKCYAVLVKKTDSIRLVPESASWDRFTKDIDPPARQVLEYTDEKAVGLAPSKAAVLLLIPVPLVGPDPAAKYALLSVVSLFPLPKREKNNVKLLQSIKHSVLAVLVGLLKTASDLGSGAETRAALDMLSKAFLARAESLPDLLSGFEIGLMFSPSDGFLPGRGCLDRLRTGLGNAKNSPVAHPLDAFCQAISGTMYSQMSELGLAPVANSMLKFGEQERLSIGDKAHRDHYLHSLKVFLLGGRLLSSIQFEDDDEKMLVRRRWVIAAWFHDVCYPIQESKHWLDDYINDLAPKGARAEINTAAVLEGWKSQAYESCWFDVLLQLIDVRVDRWFLPPPELRDEGIRLPRRAQSAPLFSLLAERNHAVLGAFSLIQQFAGAQKYNRVHIVTELCNVGDNQALDVEKSRVHEIFDASTAIMMHDPKIWEAWTGQRRFLPTNHLSKRERTASLVAWTLAVSDALQEWGRDIDMSDGSTDWRIPWYTEVLPPLDKIGGDGAITITFSYRSLLNNRLKTLVDSARKVVRVAANELDEPELKSSLIPVDGALSGIWRDLTEEVRLPDGEEPQGGWSDVAKLLSASCMYYDLLTGKTDVKSRSWARSFSRCFNPNSEYLTAIGRWLGAGTYDPIDGEKIKKVHGFGAKLVQAGKQNMSAEDLANLKRMAGFWRVPWRTFLFWRQPNGIQLTIVRQIIDPSGKRVEHDILERPRVDGSVIDKIIVAELDNPTTVK